MRVGLISILVRSHSDCNVEIGGGRVGGRAHLEGYYSNPSSSDTPASIRAVRTGTEMNTFETNF